jgi:uncharacterized membrane protein YbhN (UPF0104 family)
MNTIGVIAAFAAFLSVWFGHVAVRKIEFVSPTIWIPTTIFAALGIFVEFLSLSLVNRQLSATFGILGTTLLFDALELTRQKKRVKKGHAPANPNNPRHARILAEHPTATTQDLLKREPVAYGTPADEISQLSSNL